MIKCDVTYDEVMAAHRKCSKGKTKTDSYIEFSIQLSKNILDLTNALQNGTYEIGESVCFVVTSPNVREIWAAGYVDRIVHHILYERIERHISRKFTADSCACIPNRGTLYGAKRLERHIRKATESWKTEWYYLKCDLSNFFVSINKNVLWGILEPNLPKGWVSELTRLVLFHDPRTDVRLNSPQWKFDKVEPRKRLSLCPPSKGLPIGNLTSQFFANVLLNVVDQYVKHTLKCKYYVRYVDDMVLLHQDTKVLKQWESDINELLANMGMQLNPKKTVIQPVSRGVQFVGQLITKKGRQIAPKPKARAITIINRSMDPSYIDAHIGYLSQMTNNATYIIALLILQCSLGYRSNATLKAMQKYGFEVNRLIRTGEWIKNRYIARHFKKFHQNIHDLELRFKFLETAK